MWFFLDFGTVVLLFVCGKYCPIIDWLESKDSSRDLQANYLINFYFYLYLFDVTGNLKFFFYFWGERPYSRAENVGLVYFLDSPSHRIFRRMHGVLNIDENKN